jgi:hypothetical protein
MNDPRRLSEVGADDFECDLIHSARRDAPRPAAFRRTLAAIGVGVSLPLGVVTVAEGAVVVPAKLGAIALTKWLATGVALGVATAGGAKLTERAFEPARPALVAAAPKARAARPVPVPAVTAASRAAAPVVEEPPSTPPAVATVAAAATDVALPPAAAPSASLPEEVRSVDAARQALAQGDARGALSLIRRYEARFGSGALLPEARVLEVKALVALGERERALAAATRIIDADPRSPHAEAVRALVARVGFP